MLQELEYDSSKLNQKVAHKNWDKGRSQELGRCQAGSLCDSLSLRSLFSFFPGLLTLHTGLPSLLVSSQPAPESM